MSLTCSGVLMKFIHHGRWECWIAFPRHPCNEISANKEAFCALCPTCCVREHPARWPLVCESLAAVTVSPLSSDCSIPRMPACHGCLLLPCFLNYISVYFQKGHFSCASLPLAPTALVGGDQTWFILTFFIASGPIAFLNFGRCITRFWKNDEGSLRGIYISKFLCLLYPNIHLESYYSVTHSSLLHDFKCLWIKSAQTRELV